jgi:hypothetical protein
MRQRLICMNRASYRRRSNPKALNRCHARRSERARSSGARRPAAPSNLYRPEARACIGPPSGPPKPGRLLIDRRSSSPGNRSAISAWKPRNARVAWIERTVVLRHHRRPIRLKHSVRISETCRASLPAASHQTASNPHQLRNASTAAEKRRSFPSSVKRRCRASAVPRGRLILRRRGSGLGRPLCHRAACNSPAMDLVR